MRATTFTFRFTFPLTATLVSLLLVSSFTLAGTHTKRVALLAQNSGTEITDLLIPFALLSEAGFTTEILSTEPGPVDIGSGLQILDLRSMDAVPPKDFDLVVVPAVRNEDAANLTRWITSAYEEGAMLASICDGVKVLAAAGLLDGKRATGHFYSARHRAKTYPAILWEKDTRFIEDTNVLTTAGISASAPASVYLIEKLAGTEAASQVAHTYGIRTARSHRTSDYSVGFGEVAIGLKNLLAGIRKTKYNLKSSEPVDEYQLGFAVDTLSRTFRAATAIASPEQRLQTKHGLVIKGQSEFQHADWELVFGFESEATGKVPGSLVLNDPAMLLKRLLGHVKDTYGKRTASLVGLQLELPERGRGLYD